MSDYGTSLLLNRLAGSGLVAVNVFCSAIPMGAQ